MKIFCRCLCCNTIKLYFLSMVAVVACAFGMVACNPSPKATLSDLPWLAGAFGFAITAGIAGGMRRRYD